MPRLNISVALQPGDDIRTLTAEIEKAAGLHADGSGVGFGYRDTEYEVSDTTAGDEAGQRVKEAFPTREVVWEVLPDSDEAGEGTDYHGNE